MFFLAKKDFSLKVSAVLSILLVMSAITGLFLNLRYFSPFHVLVIVVLTTVPLAFYNLKNGDVLKYKKGLFYNFIGLNLALVGALYPERFLGVKLWSTTLHLDSNISLLSFTCIAILASITAIYSIVQVNQKPNFIK